MTFLYKRFWLAISIQVLFIGLAQADIIIIHNKTNLILSAGLYYVGFKEAQRSSDLLVLLPDSSIHVERPPLKVGIDRKLLLSTSEDKIKKLLTRDEVKLLASQAIGRLEGKEFFVVLHSDGRLKTYTTAQWHIVRPLAEKLSITTNILAQATLQPLKQLYQLHKYSQQQATIRFGTNIGTEEQKYIQARLPHVKKALERMLDTHLPDQLVPRIALCGSGGGYRAMISTLGSLIGADSFGLIDASTYISTLSGSTWTIAPWLYFGSHLLAFKQQLIKRVQSNLLQFPMSLAQMTALLLKKLALGQPMSIIDIWGGLLAHQFLGPLDTKVSATYRTYPGSLIDKWSLLVVQKIIQDAQVSAYNQTLSAQSERIKNGTWIYPIYSAIVTRIPYEWIEFTPHEVGSDYLGGYIPTWSLGRLYRNGVSIDFAPELSLGFLMGIWGSALSSNMKEILEEIALKIPFAVVRRALRFGAEETMLGGVRVLPAKIRNFTAGLLDLPRGQQELLTLIDAGISFNLPLPPLFRQERAVDIIIIFDASRTVEHAPELQRFQEYAQSKNIKIPPIDFERAGTEIVSVFKDPQAQSVPVLIYLPLIKNPNYGPFDPAAVIPNGYANTYNFVYTKEQVLELSGLTEFTIKQSKDMITQVIKDVIESKRKRFAEAE